MLLCITSLGSARVAAQDESLQSHVTAAVNLLGQLDALANACLTSLQQTSDTAGDTNCARFLSAVDGELLAQYLTHCKVLTAWRDDYVTRNFAANATASATDAELQALEVKALIGTEFACSETAMQQRTEFVTTAFAQLQQTTAGNQQGNTGLGRRLQELQFDTTLAAERQRLQDALLQQQSRREQETARRMQQQESELIRQQRGVVQ